MRIKKTNLIPAGLAAQHLINTHQWASRMRSTKVIDLWPQIAGEHIAQVSRVVRLQGGVLLVAATDTSWIEAIHYQEIRIVENANRLLGDTYVRRLRVVLDQNQKSNRF